MTTDNTAADTTWRPGRRFLLRVAGLPVDTLHGLRCPGGVRWAEDVLAAEEELAGAGRELSEVLHALVPAAESQADDAGRRALLAMRRDVFNNRVPAAGASALALVEALDPVAAARTRSWLTNRGELDRLREAGGRTLRAELAECRAALRDLVAEPRLRHGLQLASPTLERRLDAYARSASDGRPDKRTRKVERSLLSYLYRTVCKTSPFSSFTGVALGTFVEGDDPSVRLDPTWRSRARINVVVLARVAERVLASPALRADLPVRLASGWGGDERRVRYVRRWVTAGDDDAAVTFDSVRDRLFYLRRSGTLDRIITLLGTGEPRYGDLVEWLDSTYGSGAGPAEQYVSALLTLGLIRVPCLETDVHTGDPLRSFQESLRGLERPWADALAEELGAAASLVDDFPDADTAGRARILRDLRDRLERAQRLLGDDPAALPQTLLYEDVDAGANVSCGMGAWTGRDGGALRSVERILPAFDLTLPQRLTFKGFFVARHGRGGRCDDLLGLVHDFHEDFFDQYLSFTSKRVPFDAEGEYVPEENWLGLGEIKALDRARRAFVAGMRELWSRHAGDGDLVLTDEYLRPVAAELEGLRAPFTPQSHHLQVASEGGEPLLVLNRSYGGLSFPFSRFTHVWDEGGGPGVCDALREQAAGLTPPGAVLAELTGGPVTSNLNLHGRLTEYQIVCPGETSTVPEERRIHLDDLRLEHDAREDRLVLRSKRLGREVIPVYLGYLVPLALPETPRTLLLLSPTSMAPLDVWAGVPAGPARQGVARRPRVRHGDLVLARRGWSTTGAFLPLSPADASEEARFLAWRRWRRLHGLPARVFATVSGGPPGAAGTKPQYVDFDSPLSLAAFAALVKSDEDRVELREALPTEDAPHAVSDRGGHVAELSVETYTTTRHTEETAPCPM
ncbi:lantibiotic dehydratase [Streptomyces sp. WMMC905]|uniref:lantibiotic dehydratase n=1 Tax=Streptomyces sp. WMMC905 TaxID=3404123 RepID=UPI003B92AD2E